MTTTPEPNPASTPAPPKRARPARPTLHKPAGPQHPFSLAVAAAEAAYAESGRMVDAALMFALNNIPVFPCDPESKVPVPRRDPDPTGKFPKGIPQTGGHYKATCSRAQIEEWWTRREYLIGVPMGARSGVWAADIDTDKFGEHSSDGFPGWMALQAEHGEIVTREHRTAGSGVHFFFKASEFTTVWCSSGSLPKGIDIKGQGGYVIVPPSVRRDGRAYRVGVNRDPIRPPEWLLEKLGSKRLSPRPLNADGSPDLRTWQQVVLDSDTRTPAQVAREIALLKSATPYIPNPDLSWEKWTKYAMAFWATARGSEQGLELFDAFSQKSSKYDPWTCQNRWDEISGSPPNKIGVHFLLKIAAQNGWEMNVDPIVLASPIGDAATARRKLGDIFDNFLQYLGRRKDPAEWRDYVAFHREQYGPGEPIEPEVRAVKVDTGLGKTQIGIRKVARTDHAVVYAVPFHELAEDVAQQFRDLGRDAEVYRGRDRPDPHNPGRQMCLDPERVALAVAAQADVTATCCRSKQIECRFYSTCGYFRQAKLTPQIWVAASNVLFSAQPALGEPDAVIIDESCWTQGIDGIEPKDQIELPVAAFNDGTNERILAALLEQVAEDGGLRRKHFSGDLDDLLFELHGKLWAQFGEQQAYFNPAIPLAVMKAKKSALAALAVLRKKIKIVAELRSFLHHKPSAISGRLLLGRNAEGLRTIQWRGVKKISAQFQVPTLLLDATLPGRQILKAYHPQVELVADISVPMPEAVRHRQVRGAPVTKAKIGGPLEGSSAVTKNRNAIRRYILQRWFETGRGPSLVICQLELETWLTGMLPAPIKLAHFNAIAGLDQFRDVRLQIVIGRTQPGPEACEALAGALSGRMPAPATHTNNENTGFIWYDPTWKAIRLRDGRGLPVRTDVHPDPYAEEVRRQICDAELLQADGRARGVNRDADHPLDVDWLFDVALPRPVDEVSDWTDPSLFYETAWSDGVMLTAPSDMAKLWPDLWANERAAARTLADGVPTLPGFAEVTYQMTGAKQKRRTAHFDLTRVPDPRRWLEERLGALNAYAVD